MIYTVHYELSTGEDTTMEVEAISPERAIEYAGEVLDQEHSDSLLMVCEVVNQYEQ